MPKEIVKIKGTKNGLIFYFNTEEAGLEELKTNLREKLQAANGFFAQANFSISPESGLSPADHEEFAAICRSFDLVEKAMEIPAAAVISSETTTADSSPSDPASSADEHLELLRPEGDTELITHNLRSGQKVLVHGNAVILGDVNPGAQVSATGSIVVMGTLRGTVHAGFQGDQNAYVVALRMQPTQIRIADRVSRSPENRVDYPEEAFINENGIVVQPYLSSKRRKIDR